MKAIPKTPRLQAFPHSAPPPRKVASARVASVSTDVIPEGYTAIYTAIDLLKKVRDGDLSGKYILMNDIDLSPLNGYWEPIGRDKGFSGVFDGNGHVIKNFTFDRPEKECFGFFQDLNGAEIKNLGFENVNINAKCDVGVIANRTADSTITNCYATGNISAEYNVGGLISQAHNTIIENCYSGCNLDIEYGKVGGLAFYLANGSCIKNSYFNGTIETEDTAGGLVVDIEGSTIENCYVNGNVKANTPSGLLFNSSSQNSNIINCCGNGEISVIQDPFCYNSGTLSPNYGVYDNNAFAAPDFWKYMNFDSNIWDLSSLPPKLKNMPAPSPPAPSGTGGNIRLQVGPNSDPAANAIYIDISFNLDDLSVDFSNAESCVEAVKTVDKFLKEINDKMAYIGATQNRLDSVEQSQITQIENFTAAKSTIMDADIAQESAEFTKQQILTQTSSALLVQANRLNANTAMSLINSLR